MNPFCSTLSSTTDHRADTLPHAAPRTARLVFSLLRRLKEGTLDVQLPDQSIVQLGSGQAPRGILTLHRWNACARVLVSGDIGLAEGFIEGDWSSPDPCTVLCVLLANRKELEAIVYGSWWRRLLHRARHLLNRNSRRGSRRNIHAHYDLGNEFYRLWLDSTMSYSSAWFDGDASHSTRQAQLAKMQRALRECGIQPGGRLLEIGCGWGSLAEMAAGTAGAHVTGITLSTEQLAYAQDRLERAGLAARADLRLQDYRDIDDSPFDAICSIEMFEAVGREYWGSFFTAVRRLLKPGGRACIQTITISDELFERYLRSTDFIQQHVFPGGMLPSPAAFRQQARKAGLAIVNEVAFGHDYAETLFRWRDRFLGQHAHVRELGFDLRFMRTWEFYLAYCEAAFTMGSTDVMQFTLQRPVAGDQLA